MREYYIVFVDDCTAATNREIHAATLANMDSLFGVVVQSEQILGEWRAINAGPRDSEEALTRPADAVEKSLRTSPNSDSADCEDQLTGGGDDGAADWRPGESVLRVSAGRSHSGRSPASAH
jgi:hypothetical protein